MIAYSRRNKISAGVSSFRGFFLPLKNQSKFCGENADVVPMLSYGEVGENVYHW